jgi:Fe-S cluster assembly iron-binding protein IscA
MIITPAASDRMKYELTKAKRKGRVPEDVKIAMRVQILQEDGEHKLGMGIEYNDFIQDTDDIIILNNIKVVVDKESSKLLEDSTLDYYHTDKINGFRVDKIGPKEKLPEEP